MIIKDRNVYISNIDVEKAKEAFFSRINFDSFHEKINVFSSLGRVTYEAVFAKRSSPHYNGAAMDGILVRAEDTFGASETTPKILKEGADFEYINTGNAITYDYNAVIMIEDVIDLGQGKVSIINSAYPWQHVRTIGEDIVATEMIIPSGHKIRPIDLGALIAGGIESLRVYKKPRVGLIPTGSELVEDLKLLKEGKILESNTRVFEALTTELGGISNRYSPVEDDYEKLRNALLKAVEDNDIAIINAGSSAGDRDFTVKVIADLGEVLIHGVALKPGKPTILGLVNGKPVIGIPGYPVSAYLVFETFVKPLIQRYTGQKEDEDGYIEATISKRIVSSLKNKELIRVTLGYVNDRFVATPLSSGAGVTMSLVKAHGIVEIPQSLEGIEAGEKVQARLLKPVNSIKDTLVSIGSHDLIMDIIGDMMPLSSGHVGSMGGIMAMRRGECHIAPIHLLDPETGEYNTAYIKRYFKGKKVALIKGVKRIQGFMVKKGNPENIRGFEDLVRPEVTFINRQRGAGTRILLDYKLKESGLDPMNITGYEREVNTHMAVAMAVRSSSAITGLGIESAARAMDLDFIEVGYEDYDFILPYEGLEDKKLQKFIATLKSKEFIERVTSLGGYEVPNIGEIIIVGEDL